MKYQGETISVKSLDHGIVELLFDIQGESVNKIDKRMLNELRQVMAQLKSDGDIKGLVLRSGKPAFIVGADIFEFLDYFKLPEQELLTWAAEAQQFFNDLEDLPYPTVSAINGLALGGGLEMALATDYRIGTKNTTIGLPEVKLGICPGFGGTVRLPRLIGADNAIEWICGGAHNKAADALKVGALDAIVAEDQLQAAAVDLLLQCQSAKLDYRARRQEKLEPVKLNDTEYTMVFETSKGFIAAKAGPHYPAPLSAVKSIQKSAALQRKEALTMEVQTFVKLAKTTVAANLVGIFLNDQVLNKKAKACAKTALPVKQSAVLGAGIMGGGIAYQSSYKGIPILMKDINQQGIQLGLTEASTLLNKRVERGRMNNLQMAEVLNRIIPTLSYGDFSNVDIVVEAVVENKELKAGVLAETEQNVRDNTVLASNTSTISITVLAESLQRPENFCGMHFFNPVHRMPLVEVIRGEKSSDITIATTVAYAKAMGKNPIVVNDCPGFLVNRILFPYLQAFADLIRDGADFRQVDKVMEAFGWPMGPAYLLDVVGMDTAVHAQGVLADGYKDRMAVEGESIIDLLFRNKRLGQKNSSGFYAYEKDKKGKLKKTVDESVLDIIRPLQAEQKDFDSEEIIQRMMLPLCLETARCLEDGIVESAADADMGLVYGIGFPPFHGGALRYMETMGLDVFCQMADQYSHLGAKYQITEKIRQLTADGKGFYAGMGDK